MSGFGFPGPTVSALQIAKASLNETHNHLDDGFERGYFSEHDRERLQRLAGRAIKAAIRLIVYLQNCDGRTWKRRIPRRPAETLTPREISRRPEPFEPEPLEPPEPPEPVVTRSTPRP